MIGSPTVIPRTSFAHSELTGVSTAQHHTIYSDAEAVAAVEAEATLVLATDPLTLTNGQLNFPDAQSASADANELDDYEEGTFTPDIRDASDDGSGEGQSYVNQVGHYTKVGRMVHVQGKVRTSSIGSLTGANNVTIGGMPFVCSSDANAEPTVATAEGGGFAITAGNYVGGRFWGGDDKIGLEVWSATTGVASMTVTQWSADGSLYFACSYYVD